MNLVIKSTFLDRLSEEEFNLFCQEQRELRIERNADGAIIFMAPAFSETGRINSEINRQLANWNHQTKKGWVYDSSAGFTLPNSAVRSPDASWVSNVRFEALSDADKTGFIKLCPDFVLELKSSTDSLLTLQTKMLEYIENGARLAWLIDPEAANAYVYRSDGSQETLSGFDHVLSGESVLKGFELDLATLLR